MKKSLLLLAVALGAIACVREPEIDPETPSQDIIVGESGTIEVNGDPAAELGKKIDNPQKLDNISAALESLPDEIRELAPEFEVTTTHRYIKFPCNTEDELFLIKVFTNQPGDTILLFDYPFLNYELTGEGEYRDPTRTGTRANGDLEFNPLYGVFPIHVALPPVPYEILQEMCVPSEDDYPEEFVDALIDQAMILSDNEDKIGTTDARTRAKVKWSPSGRIRYWSSYAEHYTHDAFNTYREMPTHPDANWMGVKGAKVCYYSWRKAYTGWAFTDYNGYFSTKMSFKGPCLYYISWEMPGMYDIRNRGVQARYNGGPGSKDELKEGSWRRDIKGGKSLYNAIITTALSRWRPAEGGIVPAGHWSDDVFRYERHYFENEYRGERLYIVFGSRHIPDFLPYPSIIDFGQELKINVDLDYKGGMFAFNNLGNKPGNRKHDIIIGDCSSDPTIPLSLAIFNTIFHELAHAFHAYTIGYQEWDNLKIFWKESWAVYVAWFMSIWECREQIYGHAKRTSGMTGYESPDFRIQKATWINWAYRRNSNFMIYPDEKFKTYPYFGEEDGIPLTQSQLTAMGRQNWHRDMPEAFRPYSPIYVDLTDINIHTGSFQLGYRYPSGNYAFDLDFDIDEENREDNPIVSEAILFEASRSYSDSHKDYYKIQEEHRRRNGLARKYRSLPVVFPGELNRWILKIKNLDDLKALMMERMVREGTRYDPSVASRANETAVLLFSEDLNWGDETNLNDGNVSSSLYKNFTIREDDIDKYLLAYRKLDEWDNAHGDHIL